MSQVTGVSTVLLIRIGAMSSSNIPKIRVAIYSDDSAIRAAIISALGRQMASDLPTHEVIEFATAPALRAYVDRPDLSGNLKADLFILDGSVNICGITLFEPNTSLEKPPSAIFSAIAGTGKSASRQKRITLVLRRC